MIITSRSDEDWLETTNRYEIALGGLQGEERWDYCEVILRDLGLTIDRKDADVVKLMDLLGGHPLAMRVILPRLAKLKASALNFQTLQSNLSNLSPSGDPAQDKLFATLRFVEQSLADDLRPLLGAALLHERFVDADHLEIMAKQVDESWTRKKIDRFFVALAVAGLLHDRGRSIFEMHPALTGFLRATRPPVATGEPGARWSRAFVDIMGSLADRLAPRRLDEQRVPFYLHGANFHVALGEAERLGMDLALAALIQSLAAHAQNTRNFQEATRLFERLATLHGNRGEVLPQAGAYHHLGMIAEEQRDFATADQWYRKSLAIAEKQGHEYGAASNYHQLGIIAQAQRDFATAELWYRKSLVIAEKQGNEHVAAGTYHHLGIIAEEQRDFATAELWYRKSLTIAEKQGNEHGAAITYHQLGNVAYSGRDFATAELWYRKSLTIKEKQGNEHGAAITYHQLGRIAQAQRDFATADQWYRKSLAISEKHGDEHGAAITYHQLGIIAEDQRDFATAEQWYRKALAILVKYGDQHREAITRSNLEILREAAGSGSIPEPGERESPPPPE